MILRPRAALATLETEAAHCHVVPPSAVAERLGMALSAAFWHEAVRCEVLHPLDQELRAKHSKFREECHRRRIMHEDGRRKPAPLVARVHAKLRPTYLLPTHGRWPMLSPKA
eukprot:4170170-Prymnesium_polylepis.1